MRVIRRNLMWLCFLALAHGMTSCEQDTLVRDLPYENEFETAYAPTAVSKLLTPSDGEEIVADRSKTITFSWEKSKNPEGSNMYVKYEVLFGSEGCDFTKVDEKSNSVQRADNEGKNTQLSLSGAFLDIIANEAKIEAGSTGILVWKVRAYCGLDETLSSVEGKIKVTRP